MAMRKIKPESSEEMYGTLESPSSKKQVYYPTVSFDNKTLPEATKWEPGKVYEIGMQVKMTGLSMRKGKDGTERGHYDFEIVAVDNKGEVKGKTKRYT